MPTLLDKTLKRALSIKGKSYVLTLSPEGLTLVSKGRRKGHQILWTDLVSGDAALATALNASLQFNAENEMKAKTKPPGKTTRAKTIRAKSKAKPRKTAAAVTGN